MFRDEELGGNALIGLVMLGATAFFGYKAGKKNAYRTISEQQKDQELESLKNEIALLKSEKK